MPDPIEELENFTSPGLTMTPMPASEVRRRGTRLRRRNTALATVAGVAAVAVIATPLAVLASNHSDKADILPATQWHQTIPADFPLATGLPGRPTVTDRAALTEIAACGTTWWTTTEPAATVDVAGASYDGIEDSSPRTLALYDDDATAQEAMAAIQSSVDDCPVDSNGTGFDQQQDAIASDLGEQSLAFSRRSVDESGELVGELDVFAAVRVGNAVLVTSKHSQGGSSDAMATSASQDLADTSAGVVADMCVFSAEGCSTPDGAAATVIPDDFDLLAGLPTEGDATDVGRVGPNRDLAPIALDACGTKAPKSGALDQIRGDFRQAVGGHERQLMTFPDVATAQAYVDGVAGLFPCTEDGGQGVTGFYELRDTDLGDSGISAIEHFIVNGEPGPGYEITHVIRVGSAVLLSRVQVDGDNTPVTDEVQANLLTQAEAELTPAVDAMCIFTATGC
jgi:hypothetical protein